MNNHRSLFAKILRASCWAGDALLVLLAVYLAVNYRDALTVDLALALGLCVVLGGLLPLTVYFVDYLFVRNERQDMEARAPETLREALIHLDKLARRVEDAAEGATKSTLVARQVPDRIEEKLGILEEAAVRMRPESLENVAVGIESLVQRLGDLSNEWEKLKSVLQSASADDSEVLQRLGEQLPALEKALLALKDAPPQASFGEEKVVASIVEDLEQEEDSSGGADEASAGEVETFPDHDDLEDDWVEEPTELDDAAFTDELAEESDQPAAEDPEVGEAKREVAAVEESAAKSAPTKATKKAAAKKATGRPKKGRGAPSKGRAKGKSEDASPDPEAGSGKRKKAAPRVEEPMLFPSEDLAVEPVGEKIPANEGLLIVKAIVGISNKLFARGDAPLDWEEGIPLQPSGIGEWRLELPDLAEPIQCELRINDEVSAQGDLITIEPGKPLIVSPRFPRA